jgi:hypothetical protein
LLVGRSQVFSSLDSAPKVKSGIIHILPCSLTLAYVIMFASNPSETRLLVDEALTSVNIQTRLFKKATTEKRFIETTDEVRVI